MNFREKFVRPVYFVALLLICTILVIFLLVVINDCDFFRQQEAKENKPNIIIILADDLGFNDISIHGSNQIPTPNIDSLGIMGIQLNKLYGGPSCTPSRSSLMTGKYASTLGLQHEVHFNDQPYGLGLNEKTIGDHMRRGGYRTHLIGKWNMGLFEKRYTPVYRGFDSHFGYLGGVIDYYNHSMTFDNYAGFDMRDNLTLHWDSIGQYATDLFTDKAIDTIKQHDKSQPMFMFLAHLAPHAGNDYDPYQAPEDEIKKFSYIRNKERRTYAAMVSKLDQGVGKVIKALHENDMLSNSVVLFLSDNGALAVGSHANSGSNFPFRGQKNHVWEGGVRTGGAIWSPLLKQTQRISNQMLHFVDWLPTLSGIAGIEINDEIDGKNVWGALSNDLPNPRNDLLVLHDEEFAAYISGNYKLMFGTTHNGLYDGWMSKAIDASEQNLTYGENYSDSILASDAGQVLIKYSKTAYGRISKHEIDELRSKAQVTCNGHTPPKFNSISACNLLKSPCLFDITNDPCETTNLASKLPKIVESLQTKLDYYGWIAEPRRNRPGDPRSDPAKFNGVWTWWFDVIYNASPI